MKKKQGFTLIELLAVIVILAIIALIAVPLVLKSINNSRISAFERSVENALSAAELTNVVEYQNEYPIEGVNINDLDMKKGSLKNGIVIQTEEIFQAINVTDGTYCANGITGNMTITEECPEITDVTPPNVVLNKTNITTKSIEIKAVSSDPESGIENYKFKLQKTENEEVDYIDNNKNNTYKFDDLKSGSYIVSVMVTNGIGLTTIKKETISTTEIIPPTYTVTPSGWSQSKEITINYPSGNYTKEYSLDNGTTWVEYTNKITMTENGSIIARVRDEINTKTGSTLNITTIDKTEPILEVSTTQTSKSITVIAQAIDNESGIKGYKYKIGSNNYITSTNSTYTFNNLTSGTYEIEVIVENNAGLETTKSISSSTIEISVPTYTVTPSGWSQSKEITINYPSGDYTKEYSLDNGSTWKTYTNSLEFTTDSTVIARVSDGVNTLMASSLEVTELDSIAPTIELKGDSVITIFSGTTYTELGATAIDNIEGNISGRVVIKGSLNTNSPGTYTKSYYVIDNAGNQSVTITRTVIVKASYVFEYTGNYQSVTLQPGTYRFELWGAQGGIGGLGSNSTTFSLGGTGGKGGYSKGILTIENSTTFYVYVGGKGENAGISTSNINSGKGGWNGGGTSSGDNLGTYKVHNGGGGGGATDIRLISGTWSNSSSLDSRIMVAGGGGGALGCLSSNYEAMNGSSGGGINSGTRTRSTVNARCLNGAYLTGATQITGNTKGQGCNGAIQVSGGGGGYYGGICGTRVARGSMSGYYGAISSGGSGFVPGHLEVVEEYLGYTFTDTVMTEGIRKGHGRAIIQQLD